MLTTAKISALGATWEAQIEFYRDADGIEINRVWLIGAYVLGDTKRDYTSLGTSVEIEYDALTDDAQLIIDGTCSDDYLESAL